jgi:hypothetical protein
MHSAGKQSRFQRGDAFLVKAVQCTSDAQGNGGCSLSDGDWQLLFFMVFAWRTGEEMTGWPLEGNCAIKRSAQDKFGPVTFYRIDQ